MIECERCGGEVCSEAHYTPIMCNKCLEELDLVETDNTLNKAYKKLFESLNKPYEKSTILPRKGA